ncbi:uncharacterized protein DUF998 [Lutibacter sp. Hel_I_33_5]|uniref:DUF998 domain-containing protein n=1 Tax=Lutibacter sp. Hel_I_33_5 TaxID=1566289 RepID=UPI0011A2B548|nr:DUF998 domain-containing protein [Lutibacter sp. Hel_I_33_5]TVZ57039.1 uncharacterized protein DUF998 [Lutibacter sp. Hel_I_33_5]
MKKNTTFLIGILGVSLFIISSIVGGILIENYSILSQYISETYAIDTIYGVILRAFGYIPSGILLTIFCFFGATYFQPSKLIKIGFYGIGIFYGLATIMVGIFPCDSGCNKQLIDPSTSQIIHNLMGLLTYLFVPICMILVGVGLKRFSNHNRFSILSIAYGVISILFVFLLVSNSNSEYIGLYQRMVELVFIIWVITCAITIKNKKPADNNL